MQRYRHSTVCLAVGNLSVSGTVTWHMPWQARFQCGESDYFWDSVHSYWRENAAQFLSHKMFARKLSCKTCQNFLSFTVFWDSVLTPGARKLSYKTCQNFLFSTAFLDSVLMPGGRKLYCKAWQKIMFLTVFWDSVLLPGARKLSCKAWQNCLSFPVFWDWCQMLENVDTWSNPLLCYRPWD